MMIGYTGNIPLIILQDFGFLDDLENTKFERWNIEGSRKPVFKFCNKKFSTNIKFKCDAQMENDG